MWLKMISLMLLLAIVPTMASQYHTITASLTKKVINNSYRLPNTTVPLKYNINLEVLETTLNGKSNIFNGFVNIALEVIKPTNRIYFHCFVNYLNISLADTNNNNIPIIIYNKNGTTDILVIVLKKKLMIFKNYNLKIFYTGLITTNGVEGLFRIDYNANGTKEYLLVTQFQPTYARYVFPCFDEPLYKATFILSITYPEEYTAISNALVANTTIRASTKTTVFEETPKMSTYLLAFSISKLTCTNSNRRDQIIPVRVCSRDNFVNDRTLALDLGINIINAMSAWTNYNYSIGTSKMDQFAIPGLTGFAMENWGFVTFQEYYLLFDEEHTSIDSKQSIVELIAHEFAHQWFGNLITTSWWDTLFLNEGFANYFQYFIPNLIGLKYYEMDKQLIIKQQQIVFVDDAYDDSRSIVSKTLTIDDIEDQFDTFTYDKGASIINMIVNVLGQDNFQKGIRQYFQKYAFQAVAPDNLWNSLSSTINNRDLTDDFTLVEFVDNWVNKGGFPLIIVTLRGNDVILSQKRFLYDGKTDDQWYVPITYITSGNDTVGTIWLKPNSNITLTNVVANDAWIIVNHNCKGYYRVKYDTILTHRLRKAFSSNLFQFSDLNRAQIIDDTFNLALAGEIQYFDVFQIIQFLKNETSYYPWDAAIRGFNQIKDKFNDDSEIVHLINNMLLKFVNVISDNFTTTDWNKVDHVSSLKLPLVWDAACQAKQKSCIMETKMLFRKFRDNGININPNIRQIVYCNALRYSDNINRDWNFLFNRSRSFDQSHEKMYILSSLGCTTNRKLLTYYLQFSIDFLSPLNLEIIWDSVYRSSSIGLEIAFDYFLDNHSTILKHYSNAGTILTGIIEKLSTQAQIDKLEKFINQLDDDFSTIKNVAKDFKPSAKRNLKLQSRIRLDLERYFGINPLIRTQ